MSSPTLHVRYQYSNYKLENMPLWTEIDVDESKWFKNGRCASLLAELARTLQRQYHGCRSAGRLCTATVPLLASCWRALRLFPCHCRVDRLTRAMPPAPSQRCRDVAQEEGSGVLGRPHY